MSPRAKHVRRDATATAGTGAVRPMFLFATCQVGAERAVKGELLRAHPEFRLAYSRPGFLTFKLPADHTLSDDFQFDAVFARAYGFSLGNVAGPTTAERVAGLWRLAADRPFRALHVWQRDTRPPGKAGFEPEITPLATAAERAIRAGAPETAFGSSNEARSGCGPTRPAGRGQLVLDCVIVQPDEWWVGYHRANSQPSRWHGGILPAELPADAVSRAYLKMEEALRWSQLPLRAGDACAEIGSAPGGASQALLGRGLSVLGIDPADMDAAVLAHGMFRHLKMRGADVRRRVFAGMRWLTADLNMAPTYTLDTVEAIVTHRDVHVRGMLLTLKLLNWQMAADVPDWLARVRSWGFADVRARQLARNRREICVAALRHRALRRIGKKAGRLG